MKYNYKKLVYSLFFLITVYSNLNAQNITAASIFGDNMVLQQGINVPIWGNAQPNQELNLTFAGNNLKTKADANGKWMIKLPKLKQ